MSIFMESITSLFDSIICVYFITKFNNVSLKKNKFVIPAILIIFGFTLINDYFMSGFNTFATFIFLAMYIIYSLTVAKGHYIRAILSAIMFEIVFVLLSSLIYMIISMTINNFNDALQGSGSPVRYIYMIIHKVSLFAVLKILLHVFKADHSLDLRNSILTFLFSFVTIIGLGMTMHISATVNAEQIDFQILIITVAFIVVNLILYILIAQIQKLLQSRYKLRLLEEKMEFEKNRHNDATAIWTNIRKVQHDIKQHLTIISEQLENGDIEDCKKYLTELLPNVERMGNIIKSENKILDYIINSKLSNLKDTKIIISGSIGDLSDINELDLACLFGNIIDNAVEAIQSVEEKQIELLFLRQNANRIIICKNTVNGSVLKCNKELKSTKKSGDSHGYGTQIIAKIVSDYHGMIDYFEEFNMFGVQIVLPDPSFALKE